ncbi:unnamed protein product [Aureobasidium mustum]|uniref:histidine kinase n=1 Tax=Aureobasidium mustum TaxID=2773714 RepID=A0A9N8PG78_9PEZI|nr:unnamed protein product [Aureobasidium mustum]
MASLIFEPSGSLETDAHLRLVQNVDWAATSIGAIDDWPPELLLLFHLIILDPQPRILILGPDSLLLYNEAYAELVGEKHPAAIGRPLSIVFPETFEYCSSILDEVSTTGRASVEKNFCMPLIRNGRLLEIHMSWVFVPFPRKSSLVGTSVILRDETEKRLSDRRHITCHNLGLAVNLATSMSTLWDNILGSLSEREHCCPFALLYAPEPDARGDDELVYQLRGTVGDFKDNSVVTHVLNLNGTSSDRLNQRLSSALTTEDPVLLTTDDGSLPESWSKAAKTRGWEDDCTEAVVLPLQANRYHKVRALLVLGVSTRSNYDSAYKSWNEELRRIIGSTLHSLRRKEIAAMEIAQREKKANTISRQYSHLVRVMELSDVGIFSCDRNGNLLEANESWYRLSAFPRQNEPVPAFSWLESVYDEDKDLVMSHWNSMLQGKPVTHPDRPEGRWILAVCLPVMDEHGKIMSIDISHLKWAEDVQRSRVEEALEAKRQNEVFIDMTSQNPLGAVVHCADAIDESLNEMKSIMDKMQFPDEKAGQRLRELVGNSAEAVQIITSCSSHQKRIVDDLLTLSKLDSNLLQINQSPVRATSILDDMQRIFEIEAGRAEIELRIQPDSSIKAMKVDNVMLDTGRVHQILINLITNALKLSKRRVTITMGSSKKRPSDGALSTTIDFALPHTLSDTVRESEALCTGPETFFIWFTVSDTGRGIKPDEKTKLFSRFQQASPRTYAKYGGSGLGLFISRELAELQGGEIGIATELDVGSTFAFFVKTRPAALPAEQRPKDELAFCPRSGSAQTSFSSETAQIHVLVAEDNQVNQKVLKRQLTNKGYVVWTADNGQEAVDFLRQTRYWNKPDKQQGQEKDLHVILMDTEMPIMDGLTAAKEIREMQRSGELKGHVPILSVSANARPEQTSMAIAAGMDDSISKPFRIADLTPKIDRLADLAHAS